ncbi:hypothetical protein [Dysgonomonas macrotermitis]|uniref:Uncharacterized protein n=1 Tax=Dysgonomonas macrotermitis TaxID=1346286 RepID=A0A1M4UJA1_9BACT|nr:hypothetical protein [Dysgonomonas macrotermitis]SHE56728.1 hypothetical protein SAMN05444362_101619 [Dysgonomonas macrotermitis]
MKEYIHISKVRRLMNSHTEIASMKCWKKDGSIMICRNIICTSSNFKGNTFNIRFLDSGEIRKIKAFFIFEINNQEVIL